MSSISYPPSPSQHDTVGEVILGVDTHKELHVAAVVSLHGALLGSQSFPTTAEGYQAMLQWATTLGRVARAGVEGTHSYGSALSRHLLAAGVAVIEVNQPDKAHRRRRGKTDTIDAEAAARAVISGQANAIAKTSDGHVERIRLFKMAKASAIKARTQAINQLKAVLVGTDPALRDSMTGLSNLKLIRRCADLDPGQPDTPAGAATYTLRLLAHRISSTHPRGRRPQPANHRRSRRLHTPGCCTVTASVPTPQQPCCWPPATTRNGSPAKRPSRRSAEPAPSRCPRAKLNDAGSTAAATVKPTPPST